MFPSRAVGAGQPPGPVGGRDPARHTLGIGLAAGGAQGARTRAGPRPATRRRRGQDRRDTARGRGTRQATGRPPRRDAGRATGRVRHRRACGRRSTTRGPGCRPSPACTTGSGARTRSTRSAFPSSWASSASTYARRPPPGQTLTCNFAPVSVGTDQAVPLGLLPNELVTNAFEYAYPVGEGDVLIAIHPAEAGQLRLTVRERGIGLPPDLDAGEVEEPGHEPHRDARASARRSAGAVQRRSGYGVHPRLPAPARRSRSHLSRPS